MAITHTITINSLGRKLLVNELQNVINQISYTVYAESEQYPDINYSCTNKVLLNISELTSETFVPFEEVTKETAIEWLLLHEGVENTNQFSGVNLALANVQSRIDSIQSEDKAEVQWIIESQ